MSARTGQEAVRAPLRAPMPIVAVSGTVGKSTVAAALDQLLRAAGRRTVVWLDHGVAIDGHAQVGELVPWGRGLQLLLRGELDVAVQELAAATVLTVGLPAASYAGAVITNLTLNDPVYRGGAAAARQQAANRQTVAAVHPSGFLVLGADDRAVADLQHEFAGATIVCGLSRQHPPVARHLKGNGSAAYVRDGEITWEAEGARTALGLVGDLPFTLHGAAAFQVQDLLLAVGAALALGVRPAEVASGLTGLAGWPNLADRTITLESGAHCRVIVARAPHLPALQAVARLARRVARGSGRVLGSVAWAPYHRAEDRDEAARLLARTLSVVYIHGAGSEEAAELVSQVPTAGRAPTLSMRVASETEALGRLLRHSASGDRLLIVTENVAQVTALLDSYAFVP